MLTWSDKKFTRSSDPTQINQVLINLCTNANHAMPDGGIVEVTLKNVEFDETLAFKQKEEKSEEGSEE